MGTAIDDCFDVVVVQRLSMSGKIQLFQRSTKLRRDRVQRRLAQVRPAEIELRQLPAFSDDRESAGFRNSGHHGQVQCVEGFVVLVCQEVAEVVVDLTVFQRQFLQGHAAADQQLKTFRLDRRHAQVEVLKV